MLCECGCGETTTVAARSYGTFRKGDPYRFIAGHQRRKSPVEYIVEPETGCWIWQRGTTGHGYGCAGRNRMAHRVVYERLRGPIPEGMDLDHAVCNNPPCVNPDHMEPVPHMVNIQRSLGKLSHDQVRAIRANPDRLTLRGQAERFGVSKSCVYAIVHGHTWRNVA